MTNTSHTHTTIRFNVSVDRANGNSENVHSKLDKQRHHRWDDDEKSICLKHLAAKSGQKVEIILCGCHIALFRAKFGLSLVSLENSLAIFLTPFFFCSSVSICFSLVKITFIVQKIGVGTCHFQWKFILIHIFFDKTKSCSKRKFCVNLNQSRRICLVMMTTMSTSGFEVLGEYRIH